MISLIHAFSATKWGTKIPTMSQYNIFIVIDIIIFDIAFADSPGELRLRSRVMSLRLRPADYQERTGPPLDL